MTFHPTDSEKYARYAIYLAVFDAYNSKAMKLNIATATMTNALGHELWAWHVIAVSHDAIRAIVASDGRMPKPSLVRAHSVDRIETWRIMLDRKFEFDEFWEFFFARDKVTLVTRQEHGVGRLGSTVDVLDNADLFRSVGYAARVRKNIEGIWAKEQLTILDSH